MNLGSPDLVFRFGWLAISHARIFRSSWSTSTAGKSVCISSRKLAFTSNTSPTRFVGNSITVGVGGAGLTGGAEQGSGQEVVNSGFSMRDSGISKRESAGPDWCKTGACTVQDWCSSISAGAGMMLSGSRM